MENSIKEEALFTNNTEKKIVFHLKRKKKMRRKTQQKY